MAQDTSGTVKSTLKDACDLETVKIFGVQFKRSFLTTLSKVVMWVTLVCTITFAPVMMRISFTHSESGTVRKDKYIESSSHAVSFFASILIGLIVTAFSQGKEGLRECIKVKSILLLAPVSIGYAVSEVIALVAMAQCSPIMYATIHKMRLIIAAVMSQVFLRRRVSPIQWVICLTVTFIVLAFVTHSLQSGGENSLKGILLLVCNITISVACSIYADFAYKRNKASLSVQMVQGRFTACAASCLIAFFIMIKRGWVKYGPFGGAAGGWDRWVIIFVFFLIFRDWINTLNLKVLDALYKSLAGSAAVATTYLVDCFIFTKPLVITKIFLVVAIMFSVAIYALVKAIEKRAAISQQKINELSAKLKELEGDHPESTLQH